MPKRPKSKLRCLRSPSHKMLDGLITWLESVIKVFVDHTGYFAIGFLMCLDSMCIPAASEVIMSIAGVLAKQGVFNIHVAAWAGAVGSGVGNAFAYWIGQYGGRPFLKKYGKWVFIREKEIEHADHWFEKYGMWAAFIARLLPVIRTFISLPMGIYRVKFWPFMILSFVGGLIWCYLWVYLGYGFQSVREQIKPAMKVADVVIIVGVLGLIVYWFVKKRREKTA